MYQAAEPTQPRGCLSGAPCSLLAVAVGAGGAFGCLAGTLPQLRPCVRARRHGYFRDAIHEVLGFNCSFPRCFLRPKTNALK